MDKVLAGFEHFAKGRGFDTRQHGGRFCRPIVRWMWEAWKMQAEKISDLTAALARTTERNAALVNQCRDHDLRRVAAMQQAAALAEEVDRLNLVIRKRDESSDDKENRDAASR